MTLANIVRVGETAVGNPAGPGYHRGPFDPPPANQKNVRVAMSFLARPGLSPNPGEREGRRKRLREELPGAEGMESSKSKPVAGFPGMVGSTQGQRSDSRVPTWRVEVGAKLAAGTRAPQGRRSDLVGFAWTGHGQGARERMNYE